MAIRESSLRQEPARTVIAAFGAGKVADGIAVVSEITGLHPTSVQRWMYSKSKNKGTGGLIPMTHIPDLLCGAAKRNIELSFADFEPKKIPVSAG